MHGKTSTAYVVKASAVLPGKLVSYKTVQTAPAAHIGYEATEYALLFCSQYDSFNSHWGQFRKD